eukprot:69922-Pleurochrysis_carterae.AAC.3
MTFPGHFQQRRDARVRHACCVATARLQRFAAESERGAQLCKGRLLEQPEQQQLHRRREQLLGRARRPLRHTDAMRTRASNAHRRVAKSRP